MIYCDLSLNSITMPSSFTEPGKKPCDIIVYIHKYSLDFSVAQMQRLCAVIMHPHKCYQLLGWLDLFFGLCGFVQIVCDWHFSDCHTLFVVLVRVRWSLWLFSVYYEPWASVIVCSIVIQLHLVVSGLK